MWIFNYELVAIIFNTWQFFETYKDYMKEGNVFAKQKPANAKHLPSLSIGQGKL